MLLSIDVGIKNMAYCFMNSNSKQILKWGVLDLKTSATSSDSTITTHPLKCSLCKLKPYISFQEVLYCKRHMNIKIENPFLVHKPLEMLKVKELESIAQHLELNAVAPKNITKAQWITLLSPHYAQKCCLVLGSKSSSNSTSTSTSTISLITLGRNLKSHLDSIRFENLETVIIENQVSPIASRMKTLQGMVAQYFVDSYTDLKDIEFVSSQNKLKPFFKAGDAKLNYKERKAKGVEICQQLLQEQETPILDIFKQSSKKDDLADSFLQGYSYTKKVNS